MGKSAEAFRTISEVSELLDTPAHVLRFWESRFSQVKPVKRAGGRRYYRPNDLALLGGIKKLLHEDGLTIRGVQKILKEQGVRHVAGMSIYDINRLGTDDEPEDSTTEPVKERPSGGPQLNLAWPPAPTPDVASQDPALLPDPDDKGPKAEEVAKAAKPVSHRPSVAPGVQQRSELERRSAAAKSAPEAPMDVDVPTLPKGLQNNVEPIGRGAPAEKPAKTAQPPAASMLRAMDALRAKEKKSELMSVYLRLSNLRERLASTDQNARD